MTQNHIGNSQDTQQMLVFDIDGVLTNPHTMEFNTAALHRIAADLKAQIPVGFNTGRSTEWVMERVLPLLNQNVDPQSLGNLVLVTEKGGVQVVFEAGEPIIQEDTTLALPSEFLSEAKQILSTRLPNGICLSDTMFWDEGKRTMASIEKLPTVEVSVFTETRRFLREQIEILMLKHNLSGFKTDETIIATDIEHSSAGKHKGAEKVLSWLRAKNIQVASFMSFGDSPSDEIMAQVFGESGFASTFIYVGQTVLPLHINASYNRVIMSGRYDTDTAEYLARFA